MKFIGGHAALDFVNTVGGWAGDSPIEDKLEHFGDLIRWATSAQILGASDASRLAILARRHRGQASQLIERARALRRVLYRMFNCFLENENPRQADLDILRKELRVAREHQTLKATRRAFIWVWDTRPVLESLLWRISQSAGDLLTSGQLARLRRCAGETCRWMFLDTTRNHSRHWCDMKDCGNLAKVRRFRARQARR